MFREVRCGGEGGRVATNSSPHPRKGISAKKTKPIYLLPILLISPEESLLKLTALTNSVRNREARCIASFEEIIALRLPDFCCCCPLAAEEDANDVLLEERLKILSERGEEEVESVVDEVILLLLLRRLGVTVSSSSE